MTLIKWIFLIAFPMISMITPLHVLLKLTLVEQFLWVYIGGIWMAVAFYTAYYGYRGRN